MRLTSREKELYYVIKSEPLISQEELARRFGITRSSVAVHISNLMKKGVILGKGYVFNEAVTAVVIGESCININVQGENAKTTIDIVCGGFAYDFSRTLANYGLNVKVITVTGNDDISDKLMDGLRERDIDTSNIFRNTAQRSCRRVWINNVSVYDETFSWKEYEKALALRERIVLNCEWLGVDPCFQENILKRLSGKDEEKLPYLCTYIKMQHPEEIPEFLQSYSTLVIGVDTQNLDHYIGRVRSSASIRNWVITDGNSRVVYFQNDKAIDVLLLPNQSFSIEERLPFLLAGLVYGLSGGYPLRQAIRIGIGSAAGE